MSTDEMTLAMQDLMSVMSARVQPSDEGNTKPHQKKKKRISASKYWCFTWNNYTKVDLSDCLRVFKDKCKVGIIGEEVGDSGTPHLQGYIECEREFRPFEKFPFTRGKVHWEKRKGSCDDNFRYCSKSENFVSWGYKYIKDYCGEDVQMVKDTPNKFQSSVLSIVDRVHNDREIHWFVGDGNDGKTKLAKYLIFYKGACMVGGNKNDCYFGLPDKPTMVIWNCAKNDRVNMTALECIKDGLVFSPKYESQCKIFNPPIVLVFANYYPSENLNDRIIVKDLRSEKDEELFNNWEFTLE